MEMADRRQPLATSTLPLHADAVAFFPYRRRSGPCSRQLLLAVSTYEFVVSERSSSERQGGVHLFDAKGGKLIPLGGVGSGGSAEEEGSTAPRPFPGVFDIKWFPTGDEEDSPPTMGVALADGSVRMIEVVEGGEGGKPSLRETARCTPLKVGNRDQGGDERERERGQGEEEEAAPCPSSSHPLDDPEAMALYLDIDRKNLSRIAVSYSDGRVALLEATTSTLPKSPNSRTAENTETTTESKTSRLEVKALWRAHDAECWCVSFSPHCADTVYTGADDCEFFSWDLRGIGGKRGGGGRRGLEKPRRAWRAGGGGARGERTRHTAGVCCISPSPKDGDFLIATGSYDGRVRVWDSRSPREPHLVCASRAEEGGEQGNGGEAGSSPSPPSSPSSAAHLGGGAWRLVWHPHGEPRLLCAAMHAGFAVLRLEGKNGEGEDGEGQDEGRRARGLVVKIEQRYRGHGADACELNKGSATLAYGCDWAFDGDEGKLVAATASFYDNAVHLWEPL